METQELARGSGILLAISSLPSQYGIGTLGNEAYRFVDLLVDLKQKYWQVLPIGPTSFGDSPYQSSSSCAGNAYLIDLDRLIDEGLLLEEEVRCFNWGSDESKIDYAVLFENRYKVLQKAYDRFDQKDDDFQKFWEENNDWVEEYALYMTLKNQQNNITWQLWPMELRKREPQALTNCKKELKEEIGFWVFCQYEFFKQWYGLKEYANTRGIQIIGDVAFFVGSDSADVWMNQEEFLLEENGEPSLVSAAIPDKYSAEGQVWGNPLYDWKSMEENDFKWWRRRIRVTSKLFDVIRMDHFVGFVKNYAVVNGSENALNGKWIKGPGRKLTDVISQELGNTKVIADDYGGNTPISGVKKLLSKTGWLGTKVLMFAFDGNTANEHLTHNYTDNRVVVYAGTHDNETIVGYFRNKNDYELAYLYEYLNIDCKDQIPDALIRNAYESTAELAMIQMQDVLRLGNEARMNAPSTVGFNWRWRIGKEQLDESRRAWIRNLAAIYRR